MNRSKYRSTNPWSAIDQLIREKQRNLTKNYQQSIHIDPHPKDNYGKCSCDICSLRRTASKFNHIKNKHKGQHLMEQFINSLAESRNVIQVHIPQIVFFRGQSAGNLWKTNWKTGFLQKETTIITERNLFSVFKKQKQQQQQIIGDWNQIETEPITRQINQLECNKVLPLVRTRISNFQQKKLILYKKKEEMNQLEKNKKDRDFCIVKYTDGNFQIMSQTQFKHYVSHFSNEISPPDYIKMFILSKSSHHQTILVDFNEQDGNTAMYRQVFHHMAYALDQIMKIEPQYMSQQDYKLTYCQSQLSSEEYLRFKTYELVIYIYKVHMRKTKSLKIRWLLNQIDTYYIYDILQWEYLDIGSTKQSNKADKNVFFQASLYEKFPRTSKLKQEGSFSFRLNDEPNLPKRQNIHNLNNYPHLKTRNKSQNPQDFQQLRYISKTLKNRRRSQVVGVKEKYILKPLRATRGFKENNKFQNRISQSIDLTSKIFNCHF